MYSVRGIRRNSAFQLERLAFAALLLLAFSLALEVLKPFITLPIAVGGWSFTNLEALQFIVIGLWLAARLLGAGWRSPPRGLALALCFWLAVLMASTGAARSAQSSILIFDSQMLRGALTAWIAFDLTTDTRRWQMPIQAFALGGVIVYLAGLLEAAKIPAVTDWLEAMRGASMHVGDVLRISSTLPYPTIAAMVIELTLFPLLAWLLTEQRRWRRLLLIGALLAGLAAIALTFTRGGLLALSGGLAAIAALALAHRSHRRLIVLAVLAVVGSLALVLGLLITSNPVLLLRFISENGEDWYRASYSAAPKLSARPGEVLSIPVQLTNMGLHAWQSEGDQPFHLSYHLFRVYPALRLGVLYEGQRTALPHDVAPGQSVAVTATLTTPLEAGDYLIRWAMVQEDVIWFSTQDDAATETQLSLVGEPLSDAAPFTPQAFDDVPSQPTAGRLTLWRVALKMAGANPWLGVGPDNFRHVYSSYAGTYTSGSDANTHANNLYLEWLADTGIIGLLAFLGFSALLLWAAVQGLKPTSDPLWLWQLALIGSLVTWYLHGFVDYFYEFAPTNIAFWLLAGLSVSLVGSLAASAPTAKGS